MRPLHRLSNDISTIQQALNFVLFDISIFLGDINNFFKEEINHILLRICMLRQGMTDREIFSQLLQLSSWEVIFWFYMLCVSHQKLQDY